MTDRSVLIVNQERLVLVSFSMILEQAGFRCVGANTLDKARYLTQNVHCAVVDMEYPEQALATFLRECLPSGNYVGVTTGLYLECPEYYRGSDLILLPLDPHDLVKSVSTLVGRERIESLSQRDRGLSP